MSITAYSHGHLIEWDGLKWIYFDSKDPLSDDRPCANCGKAPTVEGYDACLGHIVGAKSAGHVVEKSFAVFI